MSRTQTAQRQSRKAEQTEAENRAAADRKAAREAERKAKAEARAKAKAERDAARRAEREQAAKAREEAKAAREQEKIKAKQELIDSGKLIERDGVTFTVVERDSPLEVESRAGEAVEYLKANGTVTPVVGRDLADELGGGWPQWLSFFAMLKALGLVREYRSKTGERGGAGISYLWIGDK